MTEMTARSQSGPKPVRIRPPDKGGSDDLVLVYISTGQTDPKLGESLVQQLPELWQIARVLRACDTIIKLCLRAQRSRALARNHIIHIIQYHTIPYNTIHTISYHTYHIHDTITLVATFPFLALESLLTYLPILYQNSDYRLCTKTRFTLLVL